MEKNIVTINKKVASNTKIVEVTGDIIVPDIKPDIVSIINANGTSYIYKEDITNGRVRIDGNIDTYIVYLADNGENRSIQTTLSLSENIEDGAITEKSFAKQKIFLENIEAKVLNERKISLKAIVKIKSEIYEKSEIEINNDFEELQDVQKLKETLDIKSVVGINKVKTSIKEDISADSGYEVAEILKTNVEISNLENKISFNKVLAKADANVKIIFLAEDGRIGIASSNIPVMSFIDMEKITDKNICTVDYNIRNMLFKVNSKENNSTITCQIEFEVSCEAYENKQIDVIQDMYGIKTNINFNKKYVEVETNNNEILEKININESFKVEDILNILDVNCYPKLVSTKKSGNSYNHECELVLDIYYEADSRNGLNVKTTTIPFMIKNEIEDGIEFNISNRQFTTNNENVSCDIDILYKKNNSDIKKISIIEDVNIDELEDENEYKMCMYFVKPGDTIWKIAKEFKVCMNDIVSINNIENPDKINVGDRLYIMR